MNEIPKDYKGDEYYIKFAIKQNNEFTKGVLMLGLNAIARKKGLKEANRLHRKYKMQERYLIEPLKEVPTDATISVGQVRSPN